MVDKRVCDTFYTLDNHMLEKVARNPCLGHQILSDLKWSTHVNKITNKAQYALGILRRNLFHCTDNCLILHCANNTWIRINSLKPIQ
jgi:hypothetical protein